MSFDSRNENESIIVSDSEDDTIDKSIDDDSCHVIDSSTTEESNSSYENQNPTMSKTAIDPNIPSIIVTKVKRRVARVVCSDSDDEDIDHEKEVEHCNESTGNTTDSDGEISAQRSNSNEHTQHYRPRMKKNVIYDSSSDEKEDLRSTVSSEYDNEIIDSKNLEEDSDNELDVVISLAKEDTENNVDLFRNQKKAILICNVQQSEIQLAKSKMLLKTANIDVLPDKGEKLRRNIVAQEAELEQLRNELKNISLVEIIEPSEIDNIKMGTNSNRTKNRFDSFSAEPQIIPLGNKAIEKWNREKVLTIERIQDLHESLAARPAEDARAEDPSGLRVNLLPHQQHALAWLLWREQQKTPGGVLADDMGLGKTLTMIALILASNAKGDSDESSDSDEEWIQNKKKTCYKGGTLVVCPASILHQWESEVNRHCRRGILSMDVYHGYNRESSCKRIARNDMVITTYNLAAREFKTNSTLFKIRWKRVILDEAHVIRNHKSQASEAVCNIKARNRWALTGTPIQNKALDLYAILKFLKCSPFDDLRVFKHWVDNKGAAGQQRLSTIMKSLMLRRTKQELQIKGDLESLPNKSVEIIEIKLDPEEQCIYEKVLTYSRTLFSQFLYQRAEKQQLFGEKHSEASFAGTLKDTLVHFTEAQKRLLAIHADVKTHEILVLLLRLRQICCHPALIHAMLDQGDLEQSGIEDNEGSDIDLLLGLDNMTLEDTNEDKENEIGVDQRVTKNLLTSKNPVFDQHRPSSKMRAVLAKIEEILKKGDKVIVVSQWTSMLEVVEFHLRSIKNATCGKLTGQVTVKDRQGVIESFNDPNSGIRILLLSLNAGGVGLNLTGGNHLLLLDIHWNPQLEAQAQDRIYRFGQKKDVYIYKYMCKETIEERIKRLQDHKLDVAKDVLTGVRSNAASKLSLDDMKSLFAAF